MVVVPVGVGAWGVVGNRRLRPMAINWRSWVKEAEATEAWEGEEEEVASLEARTSLPRGRGTGRKEKGGGNGKVRNTNMKIKMRNDANLR